MESGGRLCSAHRHRPEQLTPQEVGAVAAFERDDRAATFGHVPSCLPSNRGNKGRRAAQARGVIPHTLRTGSGGGTRAGSLVTARASGGAAHIPPPQLSIMHMFPQRSGGGTSLLVDGAGSEAFAPMRTVLRRAVRSRLPAALTEMSPLVRNEVRACSAGATARRGAASRWTAKPAPARREVLR